MSGKDKKPPPPPPPPPPPRLVKGEVEKPKTKVKRGKIVKP